MNTINRIRTIIATAILAASSGCEADIMDQADPAIVVEGWIEEGAGPVVILSSTVTMSTTEQKVEDLSQYLIKWAKVTVSDGEQEAILSYKVTSHYFPPYIYTTSRILGKAGKTYNLKVEYEGQTITGSTTIPPKVKIDTAYTEPTDISGQYSVKIGFQDNSETHDFYKIFCKDDSTSSMYLSAALQTIDDATLEDSKIQWNVYRGTYYDKEYNLNFVPGEKIKVKLCHIDSASFNFWTDYEKTLTLSRNALTQYTKNIRTNLSGGIGYWCGYGSDIVTVEIRE